MRSRVLALVVLTMLLATACGTGPGSSGAPPSALAASTSPTPSGPSAVPSSTAPSAPPSVPQVLDFTAQTVDGQPFQGASLAGQPVVMWFWAPWCPKCQQAGPDVAAAARQLDGKVRFIGVGGLSGSQSDMAVFVKRAGVQSFPQLADTKGSVFTRFKVVQQDTFALVSPDGSVKIVDGYGSDPDLLALARSTFGL